MKEIHFTNPDTNMEFVLELNKGIILIYGGNGSGKTTLSRNFDSDSNAVFNTDFVNRNVFITTVDGASTDKNNKENFSELFLGEDAVTIAKKVESEKTQKKEIEKAIGSTFDKLSRELVKLRLKEFTNIDEIISQITYSFTFDPEKSIDDNKKSCKVTQMLPTVIQNDDDFVQELKVFHEEDIKNDVLKKIQQNPILNDIFNNENNRILEEEIKEYNSTIQELHVIEEAFNRGTSIKDTRDWIEKGINLHVNERDCIFCGKADIKKEIEEWRNRLDNTLVTHKQRITRSLKEYQKGIGILLDNEDLYNKVIPSIIKTAKLISSAVNKYIESIDKTEVIVLQEVKLEIDEINKERNKAESDLRNYHTNKNLGDIVFIKAYYDSQVDWLEKLADKSKTLNETYAKTTAEKINAFSARLGFLKDVKVNLDNRGSMPKISLESGNRTVSLAQFSEGQRHKLALAVFFANIQDSESQFEAIVMDDPVITLDVRSYYAIRGLLMDEELIRCTSLVIMTHNIHYLYVQASNIIDNVELLGITVLYEITPDKFAELPLEVLKTDDIYLFADLLNSANSIEDFTRIFWLSSKLARYFLDVKLRFLGKASTSNPSDEILHLQIPEDQRVILQDHINILSTKCKDTNTWLKDIVIVFNALNDVLDILGFPLIVNETHFDKLRTFDENIELPKTVEARDIKEEIVVEARNIHYYSGDDKVLCQMKNYLNHPRHQITESMMVLRSSRDI